MTKYFDFVLMLITALLWTVFVVAVVNSDGICDGVCEACVFSGWCPQERK